MMVAYGQSSKFIWKRDFPMKTEFVFGAKITTKKKKHELRGLFDYRRIDDFVTCKQRI